MEPTKRSKTLYLTAKGFIIFFMLFSAYYSYSHADDLKRLGFPDYFRIELVIAKILGVLALLVPNIPLRVKEWVYAGFGISMISAFIAHINGNDPISNVLFVAIDFVLIISCMYYVSKYELEKNKAIIK